MLFFCLLGVGEVSGVMDLLEGLVLVGLGKAGTLGRALVPSLAGVCLGFGGTDFFLALTGGGFFGCLRFTVMRWRRCI